METCFATLLENIVRLNNYTIGNREKVAQAVERSEKYFIKYIKENFYDDLQKLIKNNYCVIDIETTGLSRKDDQIIEICALRVRNNEIVDTFTQLVKPTIPIPPRATKINNITNEMVENAPTIKEVIAAFVEFVGNDIVIGHNIGSFDLEFIARDCNNELGKPFLNNYMDTYPLAKITFNDMYNYKLSTLCKELGIAQSTHRAEADCLSTKQLYDKIKARNQHGYAFMFFAVQKQ